MRLEQRNRGRVKFGRIQVQLSNIGRWSSTCLQRPNPGSHLHDATAIVRANWPTIEMLACQSIAAHDRSDIRLEAALVD
jgi:hypothetical protein